MKHIHESSTSHRKPNMLGRRAGALALAGVLGVVGAVEGAKIVGNIKTNFHNMQLSNEFDDPGLARNLKSHNIDPASVTHYTVQGGDTPHSIAVKIGATEKAMPWVEKEIAGQAGGEYAIQPNTDVVVPNEQLVPDPNGGVDKD